MSKTLRLPRGVVPVIDAKDGDLPNELLQNIRRARAELAPLRRRRKLSIRLSRGRRSSKTTSTVRGHRSSMKFKLTAVYEEIPKEEGGGYVAYVEELPGAISQGDTLEEARENLRDAVELLLKANRTLAKETQAGHKVVREPIAVSVA